jgi:hypothetical protein
MKRASRWSWMAAAWITVLLAGCGGGGGGDPSRFDPQITDAYRRLVGAVQAQDINALMALVSPDYLQDGTDYNGFEASFESFFENYNDIQMDVRIDAIDYDDNNHPEHARVQFLQRITAYNPATLATEVIDDETREMIWRYEDSRWKMLGNQSSRPLAQSLRLHPVSELLGKKGAGK